MAPANPTDRRGAIREVLLQLWDPVGTGEGLRTHDPYDAYLSDVEALLDSRATDRAIAAFLAWVETERMGLRLSDPDARLGPVVQALRAIG